MLIIRIRNAEDCNDNPRRLSLRTIHGVRWFIDLPLPKEETRRIHRRQSQRNREQELKCKIHHSLAEPASSIQEW